MGLRKQKRKDKKIKYENYQVRKSVNDTSLTAKLFKSTKNKTTKNKQRRQMIAAVTKIIV